MLCYRHATLLAKQLGSLYTCAGFGKVNTVAKNNSSFFFWYQFEQPHCRDEDAYPSTLHHLF